MIGRVDLNAFLLLLGLTLFLGICVGVSLGRWLEHEQTRIRDEETAELCRRRG